MSRKKIWFWIILMLIIFLAIIFYFLFISPSADSLEQQYYTGGPDSAVKYASINKQLFGDLSDSDNKDVYGNFASPNTEVGLVAREGDYYEFGLDDKKFGGGVELIAHMKSNGHFEIAWAGQDIPPCYDMEKFSVPIGIVPRCYSYIPVDRTNTIRSIFSFIQAIPAYFYWIGKVQKKY